MTTRTLVRDAPVWAPLHYACALAAFLFAAALSTVAAQGSAPPSTQAVIFVVDKLAMEDFAEFPEALGPLIDRIADGAIGMMNVRTAAAANSANGYLSLAVGGRAAAGDWAGRALMVDETHQGEPADRYFRGLTGREPKGAVLHLGVGQLVRTGLFTEEDSGPGSLGSALQRAGRSVALLGNSDVLGERRRYGALLAMDRDGTVPMGDVGRRVMVEDTAFPGGVRTDYQGLAEALESLLGPRRAGHPGNAGDGNFEQLVDLVVVDLGDLARLEAMEPFISPDRARDLRAATLSRIASLISTLLDGDPAGVQGSGQGENASGSRRLIHLISPSPSTMFGRGGTLITPVLRWEIEDGKAAMGDGSVGMLTSATTRRDGIVTNSDFLPSILDDLGIEWKGGAGGRKWRAVAHPDSLTALMSRYQEIKSVHRQRLPVIQPYFLSVLALFFVGTLLIILTRIKVIRSLNRWASGWRFITTAFLAMPAVLLLLAIIPPRPLALTWSLIVGLSLAITLAITGLARKQAMGPAGLMGALTTALLIADISLGAPLMQRSLLGYDPVAGSRFYGIGNEYMGVLLGAALMGCALILDASDESRAFVRRAVWLPGVVFGVITFLMIHPRLGINVGGAISAACTGLAAVLLVLRRPITLTSTLAWGSAVLLLVVATAFLDSFLMGDEASHLGQVVQSVGDAGTDPLWTLFGRKVAVNLRLIRLTVWSRVVFVAFAFLVVSVFTPNWFYRGLAGRFPGLVEMTKAAVFGSIVALVANDSGVVAASTLLLWPVLTVLSVSPEVAADDLP